MTGGPSALAARVGIAGRSGRALARVPGARRSAFLDALATALSTEAVRDRVLAANREDLARATEDGLAPALVQRLRLDAVGLDRLVGGVRQLAAMPDPVGRVLVDRALDEGLDLSRVSCPLGLLAAVFEARPDAVVQIAALAIRSGNGVVLKGGREARASNRALAATVREALATGGLADAVLLLDERAEVDELLGLGREVRARTSIPVLAHAEGLCHLILDTSAEPRMATRIVLDAKCSHPAACNAIETLLWLPGAEPALAQCVRALTDAGVELRGCDRTRALHPELLPATAQDWDTEHGRLVLGVRGVPDLDGALAHVAAHGSRHTEAIVTEDRGIAERFLSEVDAACVFHNASTRFADGQRFGLGAEVGISTDKLHARGPVGVDGLLTYRWMLRGNGQVTTEYGAGGRSFLHRDR